MALWGKLDYLPFFVTSICKWEFCHFHEFFNKETSVQPKNNLLRYPWVCKIMWWIRKNIFLIFRTIFDYRQGPWMSIYGHFDSFLYSQPFFGIVKFRMESFLLFGHPLRAICHDRPSPPWWVALWGFHRASAPQGAYAPPPPTFTSTKKEHQVLFYIYTTINISIFIL